MAKVKKIYYNGELTYPMSITDAIIDPKTIKTLSVRLEELTLSALTTDEVNDTFFSVLMGDSGSGENDSN